MAKGKAKTRDSEKSEPAKMGRPLAVIDVDRVRMLSAADLNVNQLAMALDVSIATLYAHFEKTPALRVAFEEGRERGNEMLLRRAYKMAMDGDSGMMRFLLKNRHPEYREQLTVNGRVDHYAHGMNEDELVRRFDQLKQDPDVLKYLAGEQKQLLIGRVSNDDERSSYAVGNVAGAVADVVGAVSETRKEKRKTKTRSKVRKRGSRRAARI